VWEDATIKKPENRWKHHRGSHLRRLASVTLAAMLPPRLVPPGTAMGNEAAGCQTPAASVQLGDYCHRLVCIA